MCKCHSMVYGGQSAKGPASLLTSHRLDISACDRQTDRQAYLPSERWSLELVEVTSRAGDHLAGVSRDWRPPYVI